MKRLFITLFLLASLPALAQAPPWRFAQSQERVDTLTRHSSRLSYLLTWECPPAGRDFPEVGTSIGVWYQWQDKRGQVYPRSWLLLYYRAEAGRPTGKRRITLDFAANDALKLSMPRDAKECRLTFQIDSRITTFGFNDRRRWSSAAIVQTP